MNRDLADFVDKFLPEILANNAAVFAGAGLSVPAGFVDWRDLVRPLAEEMGLDADLETDFVALAQFHLNNNGRVRGALNQAIVQAIPQDRDPTKNHVLLATLPITTWWTTNYDHLIEDALRAAGGIVDVKWEVQQLPLTRPNRTATVYKMHGDVALPNDAVATRDDFENYADRRRPFLEALTADLVSKTFLFLGFSFTDPNMEHVLARVRRGMGGSQRRHYAIFKKRGRLDGESADRHAHYKRRQELFLEDLRHYGVKAILVDDYNEITEALQTLVDRYLRRTVFVSGSIFDFDPWGREAVVAFAQQLGKMLVGASSRLATGLGAGLGDAVFTGALRETMDTRESIESTMVLRPFPQSAEAGAKDKIWGPYRRELIGNAGIALFLFGNKVGKGGKVEPAAGVVREFEIALEQGAVLLPIGATGSASADLAKKALAKPKTYLPSLSSKQVASLRALSKPTEDLNALLDPTMKLISQLQGRSNDET